MVYLFVLKLVLKIKQAKPMKRNITFKLYLQKRNIKKDGTIPIYLRITQNRKYKLLSTGISIDEKHWNPDKSEIRKNHPRNKFLNSQLERFVYEAKKTLESLPDSEKKAGAIKEALQVNPADQDNFFEYANMFVDKLEQDKRYWEWKQTRVTLNKLKAYHSGTLDFSDITKPFLEGFKQYLKVEFQNGNNTINKQFQRIRRITKSAIEAGKLTNDPFLGFEGMPKEKNEKTRLSIEQIQAIEALKLKPGSPLDITRDAFLFSFYNAGIRFGDMARLKWNHIIDGRLKYNMAKTRTGKNIKLLAPALRILDKYKPEQPKQDAFIFPLLKPDKNYSDEMFLKKQISSKNFIANKNLKKLAEMAGIHENISFHVSRHSFADYARTAGMSIYDISKALGHSDIQITQMYLKSFDETSLDSSMEALFS
jgi:integrase